MGDYIFSGSESEDEEVDVLSPKDEEESEDEEVDILSSKLGKLKIKKLSEKEKLERELESLYKAPSPDEEQQEERPISPDLTDKERAELEIQRLRSKKTKKRDRPERRKVEYHRVEPGVEGYEIEVPELRPTECTICGQSQPDISKHTIEKHPIMYYNFLLPHCTCLNEEGNPTPISPRAQEYFELIRKHSFIDTMKKMNISRMCCRSKFASPVVMPMIDRHRDRFVDTIEKKRMDTKFITIHGVPKLPVVGKEKKKTSKRRDMAPEL